MYVVVGFMTLVVGDAGAAGGGGGGAATALPGGHGLLLGQHIGEPKWN